MRPSSHLHQFSVKIVVLACTMLVAFASARADAVFDNLSTAQSFGLTNGTTVGASLLTGSSALSLTDLVFPQINNGASTYVVGEMFSIAARNSDGTVGTTLYTSFTLSNDTVSGQTTVFPVTNVPVVLLPNSGYWFLVTAASGTSWNFTTDTTYTSLYGVTQPAADAAYKTTAAGPVYFSLAQGPQLYHVDATTTIVPEPSPYCLLAAGLGIFLFMRVSANRAKTLC